MATDNFCFYLLNRLIQTSQSGGQLYTDTPPFEYSLIPKSCQEKASFILPQTSVTKKNRFHLIAAKLFKDLRLGVNVEGRRKLIDNFRNVDLVNFQRSVDKSYATHFKLRFERFTS
jgi:hypothetical protein